MKPYFIECSTPSTSYRGYEYENHPINLNKCVCVKKSMYKTYPDNTGTPSIIFSGCNEQWIYKTVAARDLDFQRIIDTKN